MKSNHSFNVLHICRFVLPLVCMFLFHSVHSYICICVLIYVPVCEIKVHCNNVSRCWNSSLNRTSRGSMCLDLLHCTVCFISSPSGQRKLVFLEPPNVRPNTNIRSDTEATLESRANKNKSPGCASLVVPVMHPWARWLMMVRWKWGNRCTQM